MLVKILYSGVSGAHSILAYDKYAPSLVSLAAWL